MKNKPCLLSAAVWLCLCGFSQNQQAGGGMAASVAEGQQAPRHQRDEPAAAVGGQPKALDLSLPSWSAPGLGAQAPGAPTAAKDGLFADGGDKKTPATGLKLQGHVIMSQEAEAGRQPAPEGAGIVIQLRQ